MSIMLVGVMLVSVMLEGVSVIMWELVGDKTNTYFQQH